ncbi:MAG: transketolase family protein [Anaerolineae bacterium]
MESVRDAFGHALVALGRENRNVVVLDADLATSTRTHYFAEAFPDRFFQSGVAEQNMMGVAAGLALMGKTPFAATFGVFASKRACDQVSISIAYPGVNVKIVGAYSGIVSGNNGATHQAIEDVAIMRAMPGMTVIDPGDDIEMRQVVPAIAAHHGPVYLRVTRDAWPRVSPPGYSFAIGRGVVIRQGSDVTLVGSGMMTSQCFLAAEALAAEGVRARVLHLPTIKPIDRQAIIAAARETGALVTAENHTIYGGLGSAVAEVLVEECPVPMARVGLQDTFGECGTDEELLEKYGLSPGHIAAAARRLIRRKPD